MAKTSKRKSVVVDGDRQAPTEAWTPETLLAALRRGTDHDRVEALKAAGIVDANGKLTKTYKSWGNKVTRTPAA